MDLLYKLLHTKRFYTAYHIRFNFKHQEAALFKFLCVKVRLGPHAKKVYCSRKLNRSDKVNGQNTLIVKRYLNDIFKLKKLIFVENPGANLTLQISTNQGFGTDAATYS